MGKGGNSMRGKRKLAGKELRDYMEFRKRGKRHGDRRKERGGGKSWWRVALDLADA